MKKTILFLLALALTVLCGAALADDEQTYQSAGFEYALLPNGDAELIQYLGNAGTVVIPNELDGHPITAVRRNPFYYYNGSRDYGAKDCTVSVSTGHPYLATIDGVLFGMSDRKLIYCPPSRSGEYEIPQGIWNIGDYAFYDCRSLTSVTIPDSVTSIGSWAFSYCTSLTSVTIPDSVTSIGLAAFYGCSSLISVTIPDSVTSIGDDAFRRCSQLVITVTPNSYAEVYCMEHSLQYVTTGATYGDRTDWLD